jgi:hypothetical protein
MKGGGVRTREDTGCAALARALPKRSEACAVATFAEACAVAALAEGLRRSSDRRWSTIDFLNFLSLFIPATFSLKTGN